MLKSPEEEHPQKAIGWAAIDTSGVLSPFKFSRRANRDEDVTLKILYCGVCHSDLHTLNGVSPFIPSSLDIHEIVGVVTEVGKKVTKFKIGDKAGVGCMVGSCRACPSCKHDSENYCPKMILTYGAIYQDGTPTYGGSSDMIVVEEHFVVQFPDNLPLNAGAPLLCAGITVYSPLKCWKNG